MTPAALHKITTQFARLFPDHVREPETHFCTVLANDGHTFTVGHVREKGAVSEPWFIFLSKEGDRVQQLLSRLEVQQDGQALFNHFRRNDICCSLLIHT